MKSEPEAITRVPDHVDRSPKAGSNRLRLIFSSRFVLAVLTTAVVIICIELKLISDMTNHLNRFEPIAGQLTQIRNIMFVLLIVSAASFGAVIYLYAARVLGPLSLIESAAGHVSKGNLSVTATMDKKNDFGDLAASINNIAVNFQEILLITGTCVGNTNQALNHLQTILTKMESSNPQDQIEDQILFIKKNLDVLSSLLGDFEFYNTRFDGMQVLAKNPGDKHEIEGMSEFCRRRKEEK
jgi:HAMP domain-containing protein